MSSAYSPKAKRAFGSIDVLVNNAGAVSDDLLTISGEKHEEKEQKDKDYDYSQRRFGSFRRAVQLPNTSTKTRSRRNSRTAFSM